MCTIFREQSRTYPWAASFFQQLDKLRIPEIPQFLPRACFYVGSLEWAQWYGFTLGGWVCVYKPARYQQRNGKGSWRVALKINTYTTGVQQFLIWKDYYYYSSEAVCLFKSYSAFWVAGVASDRNSIICAILLHCRKIRPPIHGWRNRGDAQGVKAKARVEYFYVFPVMEILFRVFYRQFGR